jgi:acyl CoA:acetate/3-ketoacid CoA transferase beta subunit
MTSPANEADVARVLERAAQECESKQGVWLGGGLPQALKDSTGSQVEPESADLAFVEVATVSPNGIATTIDLPPSLSCRLIGLSASPYKALSSLIQTSNETGVAISRLICPFAVFDFGPNGPIVREIRRGLTAADLQQKLPTPLWAGPDLQELGTH